VSTGLNRLQQVSTGRVRGGGTAPTGVNRRQQVEGRIFSSPYWGEQCQPEFHGFLCNYLHV
jgi:hypothetical protein